MSQKNILRYTRKSITSLIKVNINGSKVNKKVYYKEENILDLRSESE